MEPLDRTVVYACGCLSLDFRHHFMFLKDRLLKR